MNHSVFISYSSKDQVLANAVCARLEQNGIKCWIAPRDGQPGQPYGEEIIDAIVESTVMVLIFSEHSNASPQVANEVERAMSKSRVIIPFRITDVQPSGAIEYFIGSRHWLDALTPPIEQHIDRLVATVRGVLGSSAPVAAAPAIARSPKPLSRRLAPFAVAALSLAIGMLLLGPWGCHQPEPGDRDVRTPTHPVDPPRSSEKIAVDDEQRVHFVADFDPLRSFEIGPDSYFTGSYQEGDEPHVFIALPRYPADPSHDLWGEAFFDMPPQQATGMEGVLTPQLRQLKFTIPGVDKRTVVFEFELNEAGRTGSGTWFMGENHNGPATVDAFEKGDLTLEQDDVMSGTLVGLGRDLPITVSGFGQREPPSFYLATVRYIWKAGPKPADVQIGASVRVAGRTAILVIDASTELPGELTVFGSIPKDGPTDTIVGHWRDWKGAKGEARLKLVRKQR